MQENIQNTNKKRKRSSDSAPQEKSLDNQPPLESPDSSPPTLIYPVPSIPSELSSSYSLILSRNPPVPKSSISGVIQNPPVPEPPVSRVRNPEQRVPLLPQEQFPSSISPKLLTLVAQLQELQEEKAPTRELTSRKLEEFYKALSAPDTKTQLKRIHQAFSSESVSDNKRQDDQNSENPQRVPGSRRG